ncbi:hypothetical protein P3S68_025048 [Capsicum galapagoense]
MEKKQQTVSVIARLMGLDELPPRKHLPVKRRRILSENYLQKTASIGLREKSSFSVGLSRGPKTQKHRVVKDVSAAKLKMQKYTNSSFTSIKDSEGTSQSLLSTKHLRTVHSAVGKPIGKMSARTTAEENTSRSLQTLESGTPKDDAGERSIHQSKKVHVQFDPNTDMPHPSTRIIVVKPSSGKYRNTKDYNSKLTSRAESLSDAILKVEVLNPPSSKLFSTQRKDDTLNSFSKKSFSKESKKQNIVRPKSNDLQDIETTCRSQRLGEVLVSDDLEMRPQFPDSKRDAHNFCSSFSMDTKISGSCNPLGISSKDGWKEDEYIKKPPIPNHSAGSRIASGSPEGTIGHKTSQYGWHLRQKVAVTEKHSMCMNQKQKANVEYRDVNSKETYQHSPNSVLELPFQEEKHCISAFDGLCSVAQQLQYLETNSDETYSEGSEMDVSSDGESEGRSPVRLQGSEIILKDFKTADGRDFSYLVDVLDAASLHGMNLGMCFETWHSLESPVNPSVFETLEKKYGKQLYWLKLERKLLFDHINFGLSEILHSFREIHVMEKSLKRRCSSVMRRSDIEEELWRMLVSHENLVHKDLSGKAIGNETRWLQVEEEIGSICREIEEYLFDELAAELALH